MKRIDYINLDARLNAIEHRAPLSASIQLLDTSVRALCPKSMTVQGTWYWAK